MTQNEFILNKDEYFFLKCGDIPIEEVAMPYLLDIIWSSNNKQIIIGKAYSFDITENLDELLSKALDNKLFFDENKFINIGLIWSMFENPEQAKPILLEYADQQGLQGELLGQNYVPNLLCAAYHFTKNHKKTYIYNNELGEIVLLVAPHFLWKDDPEDSDYFDVSESEMERYLDYLKNYKPIFKKTIPREIAYQWLEQAKYLNKLFRENEFGKCVNCKKDVVIDFEKHPNGIYHERLVEE